MLEAKLEEAALLKRLLDCGSLSLTRRARVLTLPLFSHQRVGVRCQFRVH